MHLAPDIVLHLTKAALLRQGLTMDGTPQIEFETCISLVSTGHVPLLLKDKENEMTEKERESLHELSLARQHWQRVIAAVVFQMRMEKGQVGTYYYLQTFS